MPYTVSSPPDRIKDLPDHAQEIWIAAYNNAIKQYNGDEQKANATAWSAVTKAGYKKSGDTWVKASEKIDLNDWIEVFKAGKYPQGEFTPKDIDDIIENFNPSYHEPPFVPDHKEDGPAWGWTFALKKVGTSLWAKIKDITKEAKERIESGEYRKISVAIYDNFEKTGKRALKHIAVLGAGIPQIKGLQTFSDVHGNFVKITDQEDIDDFQTQDKEDNENKGGPDMDEKKMQELIDNATMKLREELQVKQTEFDEKFKTLTDENKKLTEQVEQGKVKLTERAMQEKKNEIHAFCETLKLKGKFPPAWQDAGIETWLFSLDDTSELTFKEGDKEIKATAYKFARLFLEKHIPQVVIFKELSKEKDGESETEAQLFEVGDSHKKEPIRNVELTQKALKLAKEKQITFKEALTQISKQEG